MTRKHFEMIAAVVAEIKDTDDREATAARFAFLLPSYNANFNRERFFEACGVGS